VAEWLVQPLWQSGWVAEWQLRFGEPCCTSTQIANANLRANLEAPKGFTTNWKLDALAPKVQLEPKSF